jgi:hypothetical protein
MNPWGENYYYNFKYYVDQHILNGEMIEKDLNELYSQVKGKNEAIFNLNDKIAFSATELNNLSSLLKSISYCIASCLERITSIDADLQNTELSKTDKTTLKSHKKRYNAQKKKYKDQQDKIQMEYDKLKTEYDTWNAQVKELQKSKEDLIYIFEMKYAQYIKEGVWSDSSYIDNNTYFLDSQKVSNTSAMPKTSWNISAIDGSVIEELEDFKISVGDQTILVDNEFFGIAPNIEQNYVFEVLITGIKEYLDNKAKNEIEVRNYLTSFEDIFQRISAATQTLELNEQTYDKAAYFKSDGTVDKDIMQSTLLQNALTLANSSDNSYVLNETGLSLQSLINPAKKMRAIADGIFFSNSTNITNGQPEWKTGITAEGINASVITSGQLNTSLIKIYSDGQVNFSWGAEGITAYDSENSNETEDSFIRLDGFGLYSIRQKEGFQLLDDGRPWFDGLSRVEAIKNIRDEATFSLTDQGLRIRNQEEDIIIDLQSQGENTIAGWNINRYQMVNNYRLDNGTYEVFGMQVPHGTTNALAIGNVGEDASRWGKAPFRVTHEGKLYATGVEIDGKIISDEGRIGGWDISENALRYIDDKNRVRMFLCGTGTTEEKYTVGDSTHKNWLMWASKIITKNDEEERVGTFGLTKSGKIYATDATIEGKIIATEGHFSDKVTIGDDEDKTTLTAKKLQSLFNSATGGGKGDTYITNIYAGGGSVGGWGIGGDSLYSSDGSIVLDSDTPSIMAYVNGSKNYAIGFKPAVGVPALCFSTNGIEAYLYTYYNETNDRVELHFNRHGYSIDGPEGAIVWATKDGVTFPSH